MARKNGANGPYGRMRLLPTLLLAMGAVCPLPAQWQIFAEKLPEAGNWSTYRMERSRDGKVFSTSELRVSVTEGGEIGGALGPAWTRGRGGEQAGGGDGERSEHGIEHIARGG